MSERKGTKALEIWCKRLVKDCPDVQIDNMTTSWRNGIAFCALVHHFRPDLVDMSKLKPENIYDNNKLAFSIAEKHLGIPALLDPEDMVENEVPDRLSILTYLSQFYQRLGHTVNTKAAETEPKTSNSPTLSTAPFKFGKAGLDKCAACGLPVYLAQRLIVSHKLYHRRCFRCSKCSGHMNPKNFERIEGSDLLCDSCKNESTLSKYLNNNEQMGMLAFCDDAPDSKPEPPPVEEPITPKHRTRPQSILDKISMFENNKEKDTNIENKLSNLTLKDNTYASNKDQSTPNVSSTSDSQSELNETDSKLTEKEALDKDEDKSQIKPPEKVYRRNVNKFNFLQTQLAKDVGHDNGLDDADVITKKREDCDDIIDEKFEIKDENSSTNVLKADSNVTDDIRIAKRNSITGAELQPEERNESSISEPEVKITVPPRKKKLLNSPEKTVKSEEKSVKESVTNKMDAVDYPDDLNPFSDDDEEEGAKPKKESTNPFGSSDEEDDDVPPIQNPPKIPTTHAAPTRRVISANPFWSDGEEPSSDEETINDTSSTAYNSLTTSTPNAANSTTRRKKARAPPPPPVVQVTEHSSHLDPATSMDDVASISSLSSYNSTVHSDQKSFGKLTPRLKKKRLAPTPPDSLSTVSICGGSMEKGIDSAGRHNTSDSSRKAKGPAPGLPLPERREVKLQMSPAELQVQLELLDTQQLGLERQGVLIEQMIRDKCEGDEGSTAPQEEVEDLVIQLCELVNEKNDLFRKQTELMYIRRQQRLEQEQADIEHEIRVIQSRPAVNRCDADKAREEQLVLRLVQIVRMRDELVQQLDSERRRERQEDIAIAASIASKRAKRNSESNSSSMKSLEVTPTPKKNRVKDKVKKQLKKAKHSLISKKKEDTEHKQEKPEKEKKAK